MKSPLQILSLEDDSLDAELILATLVRASIACEVVRVETEPDFIGALEKSRFDLILSDHSLPTFDGESALKLSLDKVPGVPFIFVSGAICEDLAIELIKSGATDYVLKSRLSRLVPAVRRAIVEAEERAARQEAEETVAARTRELAEANERLTMLDRAKSDFLDLISHEFRAPLSGLLGVGELILDRMSSTAENKKLQEAFENSRRRILSILEDALLLSQIEGSGEKFRSGLVSLSATLDRAIESAAAFAESRHVTLHPFSPTTDLVLGDEDLLARAFHALLETSVKFCQQGAAVRLTREVLHDSLTVIIESHGRTIPDPAIAKFFDIFATGDAITPGGDLGLGPPVAYRILSLFGASVNIANLDQSGIRFTVAFRNKHSPSPELPVSRQ